MKFNPLDPLDPQAPILPLNLYRLNCDQASDIALSFHELFSSQAFPDRQFRKPSNPRKEATPRRLDFTKEYRDVPVEQRRSKFFRADICMLIFGGTIIFGPCVTLEAHPLWLIGK